MQSIQDKGSATTRRSAGLPSTVVGILSATPSSDLFKHGISRLIHEAGIAAPQSVRHGDSLPQVHALNCLRSIFINTTLGQHTEPYVSICLTLAGKCLTNHIWAIRNCGLMLFRALIDRLLGSADSQNWTDDLAVNSRAKVSYADLPDLLDIVYKLLTPDVNQLGSPQTALESVFPALKLIQRIPPPASERDKIRNLVLELCGSPHWHVRDMAARTYALLVPAIDRLEKSATLIPDVIFGQNYLHGRLLCVSWLLKFELLSGDKDWRALGDFKKTMQDKEAQLLLDNRCPYTRALYLDIMNMMGLHLLKLGSSATPGWQHDKSDITLMLQQPVATQKSAALNTLLPYLRDRQVARDGDDTSHNFGSADDSLASFLLWLHLEVPDTALQVLQDAVEHAELVPTPSLEAIAKHLCLFARHRENDDLQTLSSIRSLLTQVYLLLDERPTALSSALTTIDMNKTFEHAERPPPSLVESTVQLWGMLIDRDCAVEAGAIILVLEAAHSLLHILRALIEERQPFDLRIAAARSLKSMPKIWSLQSKDVPTKCRLAETHLSLSLLVYDLLNDDDEEIRGIAVDIATEALSPGTARTRQVVPLLAGQRFLAHMSKTYSHLSRFFEEVVSRVTGLDVHTSAGVAFAAASATNNALFAVEKQNLFVDPVREVILWSQALKQIPMDTMFPAHSSSSTTRMLTKWTREALALMKEKLASESGEDGVLGWTSKPDMFVFGMRLWCVVDVAFERRRKLGRRSDRLLGQMVGILDLGRKKEAHPLWLKKIEKVVMRELRWRMRNSQVGDRIRAMEDLVATGSRHAA